MLFLYKHIKKEVTFTYHFAKSNYMKKEYCYKAKMKKVNSFLSTKIYKYF
jgi:hypothetical protein